jgi:hypothetical protein
MFELGLTVFAAEAEMQVVEAPLMGEAFLNDSSDV